MIAHWKRRRTSLTRYDTDGKVGEKGRQLSDTENVEPGGDDRGKSTSTLPPAVFVGISIVCTGLFVVNIIADIFVAGYNGYPTTALLGLLVGSVLGVERFIKGR